jgi:hypothetical protein
MGTHNQAELIKIATLAYWRYVKHHPMGAIECKNADVLTVNRSFMLTESEVKLSIQDMQREITTKRYKHLRMNGGIPSLYPEAHYFYFVLPEELCEKGLAVCDERYPYAGLLAFQDGDIDIYAPRNIRPIRLSRRFQRRKVEGKELLEIGYGISNTVTRYINKYLNLGT